MRNEHRVGTWARLRRALRHATVALSQLRDRDGRGHRLAPDLRYLAWELEQVAKDLDRIAEDERASLAAERASPEPPATFFIT